MAPKIPEEGSPARAALEKSLTLNKKQSWFGSIKNAVHQSALSAKAAVESLRSGSSTHTSLIDTDTPRPSTDILSTQHSTPGKQSVRHTPSTTRSTVTSVRHHLTRRSRNPDKADRGSVSSVFRRSSNASSLRGPETHARHSRDLSWRKSMLNMRTDMQEDVTSSASSIPLPSSPIAIPTLAPKLKLDFGTPEMLSPFAGMTDAVLTEIKVLQDPKNITTGRPSCGPVKWPLENKRPCPLPRQPVVSETLSANVESKQALTRPEDFNVGLTPKTEDPFSHDFSPITVPGLSLQSEPNAIKQKSSDQTKPKEIGRLDCAPVEMDAKPHHSYAETTSALEARNPDGIEDFAGVSLRAMSDVSTTPAKALVSHAKESVASEEEPGSPIELLELPPPLFSLPSKDVGNNNDRGQTKFAGSTAPELQVDCTQRPSIAPSVSALSSLIAGADQKSRDDTSIEEPVIAGLSLSRKGSCSVVTRESSDSSYENDDTPMKAKAWSPLSAIDLASIRAVQDPLTIQGSDYLRRDSLFDDTNADDSNEDDIPQHGPPSPTRKVKLPLRPKNEFISRASYKSLVFKPNLDRAAAKQLGVFRAESDPSLRQRYFPHLPVSPSSRVNHARQSSLDSDDGGTPPTQSGSERSAIFERAVETPSPLQIRKQSGFTVSHFSSPGTPKEGPDSAHAPSCSSPIRTPSMGDRKLFDLQRAERNARYNAIHLSGPDAKYGSDSDLQLADFDHAGPGSCASSPKRIESDESIDMKAAEFLLKQALAALSTA